MGRGGRLHFFSVFFLAGETARASGGVEVANSKFFFPTSSSSPIATRRNTVIFFEFLGDMKMLLGVLKFDSPPFFALANSHLFFLLLLSFRPPLLLFFYKEKTKEKKLGILSVCNKEPVALSLRSSISRARIGGGKSRTTREASKGEEKEERWKRKVKKRYKTLLSLYLYLFLPQPLSLNGTTPSPAWQRRRRRLSPRPRRP